MPHLLTPLTLLTLGPALFAFATQINSVFNFRIPLIATAILLTAVGVLTLINNLSSRPISSSAFRLDLFLRFARKPKKDSTPFIPALPIRSLMRLTPRSLFFDPAKAKPGRIRKILKSLGPSWLAAPARRFTQAFCLLAFLYLLFYVCWPYDAKPSANSPGWLPLQVDPQTSQALLLNESPQILTLEIGSRYHITDETLGPTDAPYLGPFILDTIQSQEISLRPAQPLSPDALEIIAFSPGPWTLHQSTPGAWPRHYADQRKAKEIIPAETFLILDPLLSLSTAIAARTWVWSLAWAAAILIICLLIPRGFCGYLCPLGTLIDLFDYTITKRTKRFRIPGEGWWVHIKYYLLATTLITSFFGILLTGFVAAIPVVTRALIFIVNPFVDGFARGSHLVPPLNLGHFLSISLFIAVLALGFLRPRFWCKYVCPTGAVFSLGNLFRLSQRHVEDTCINCNRCVEVCPFDAIKPDFNTRTTDCTLCQTCAGVCPTHAIKFVERTNTISLKVINDPPTNETPLGRRGFIAATLGLTSTVAGAAAATLTTKSLGANLSDPNVFRPVRPPGSVPEQDFLQLCIRCGECFKACPNNVLQPLAFEQGLEGLWTPAMNANWAGCEPSCNNCGQVCPTSAILPLPIHIKKTTRMGLAILNEQTCLPYAGAQDCQLCVDECVAAGYNAIEFLTVGTQADPQGYPIEGTGFLAPVVLPDKCVGCGLCQTRCNIINVKEKNLLVESAIIIKAGQGREDRLSG